MDPSDSGISIACRMLNQTYTLIVILKNVARTERCQMDNFTPEPKVSHVARTGCRPQTVVREKTKSERERERETESE
jgi:hypothetical protein